MLKKIIENLSESAKSIEHGLGKSDGFKYLKEGSDILHDEIVRLKEFSDELSKVVGEAEELLRRIEKEDLEFEETRDLVEEIFLRLDNLIYGIGE